MMRTVPSGFCLLLAVLLLALAPMPTHCQEKKTTGAVALQEKLASSVSFPEFDDPKLTLGEALKVIATRNDIRIAINEKVFRAAGRTDIAKAEVFNERPFTPSGLSFGAELQAILARGDENGVELRFVVRRDHVEITTKQALLDEFFPNRTELEHQPQPLVIASIRKVPLEDALTKLARTHDVNIVLDVRVGEVAKAAVSAEFMNVPLDTAVRLLADMAGLKTVQIDNVLYVTTVANAVALQREQDLKTMSGMGPSPGTGVPPQATGNPTMQK